MGCLWSGSGNKRLKNTTNGQTEFSGSFEGILGAGMGRWLINDVKVTCKNL